MCIRDRGKGAALIGPEPFVVLADGNFVAGQMDRDISLKNAQVVLRGDCA